MVNSVRSLRIKKNLLFLFPFYIFNLESEIKTYDKEESRTRVVNSITELLEYVNGMYNDKKLTFDKYLLITDMIRKVADNLSEKYGNARKEIDEIMGGKILEFKGERIYNEGREEGKKEGKKEGKIEELLGLAYDKAMTVEAAAERAETKYHVSKSDFMEMLKSYKPDDELMQG